MEADRSTPSSSTTSVELPTAAAELTIILMPVELHEDLDGPDTPARKGRS
jgi:hypothetical protein